MIEPVVIIGLGAEGPGNLKPSARALIRDATFLAGGRRHLELLGATAVETLAITDNIDRLLDRLARRAPGERCVVLASGDPLYFGIADRIIQAIGSDQVRVEPQVSSMQLAFARVGLPWHDATIASIHGRPLKATLLPLLNQAKLGLFTQDGQSPSDVARFFIERGRASSYDAWVCENLGTEQEAIHACALPALVDRKFGPLNVLILIDRSPARRPLDPCDAQFAQPDSGAVLLTHEDIRALVVRRFQGLPEGPIWDIGAGLGGVSVALAREFPTREIVAVERSGIQRTFLATNRARFETWNIRIVEGEAPECLTGEDVPAGVFLGGSGGRLDAIFNTVVERLAPEGRFVANFVGLENLATVMAHLRTLGWRSDLSQIQVAEGRPLAGLTTLIPQRPVWIVRAEKP